MTKRDLKVVKVSQFKRKENKAMMLRFIRKAKKSKWCFMATDTMFYRINMSEPEVIGEMEVMKKVIIDRMLENKNEV